MGAGPNRRMRDVVRFGRVPVGHRRLRLLLVLAARLAPDLEMAVSFYNLFDRRYADPVGPEIVPTALQQDGRTFRAKFTYTFR